MSICRKFGPIYGMDKFHVMRFLAESQPSPVQAVFHNVEVHRGVDTTPPRVSKLRAVELSGKNSGLLSTSTRDWLCDFWS